MRIAAFSDWRVQPFGPLIAWLRKVHPDIILYGGDDTVRLGEISESALHKIAQDFEGGEETITPSNQENIIIESNTTLSKFKQKHEHLEKGSLFDQLAALGIVKMKPRTKGQWIGPPRRNRGTCVYYKRKGESWLDVIASQSTHGLGAVVGNDCEWVDRYRLSGENIFNLHEDPLILGDLAVLGLEGSPLDIGFILYEEDDAREHLEFQHFTIGPVRAFRRRCIPPPYRRY